MQKEEVRAAVGAVDMGTEGRPKPSAAPRKWRRMLEWLAAGNSLNREAARHLAIGA